MSSGNGLKAGALASMCLVLMACGGSDVCSSDLDGSWGLESVDVDDVQVPRTFGFSIGLNQKF